MNRIQVTKQWSHSQVCNHLLHSRTQFPFSSPNCSLCRRTCPLSQILLQGDCWSAQTLQIIFIHHLDDVLYQEDIILCPSLAEVVPLSVFMASWLRIIVTAGGSRGPVLLSWHPLQNNWMAYQVMPRSLISLFRSWLAENTIFFGGKESSVLCLDITNSCQHVYGWSVQPCLLLSINCPRSRLAGCAVRATIKPFFTFFSLRHLSSEKWFLKHFFSFSSPSSTDWLIHVRMPLYLLIQCYPVIFGDGLLSRCSLALNWFSIMTTNKPEFWKANDKQTLALFVPSFTRSCIIIKCMWKGIG